MQRLLALAAALLVPAVALGLLKAPWRALLEPWLISLPQGPAVLLAHLLYGLPVAVLTLLVWRAFRLGPLRWRMTHRAWQEGVLLALVSLAITVPLMVNFPLQFSLWNEAGNLVSNFYEELSFRALLVLAALKCWDRPPFAILISGVAFALVRQGGPWRLQLNLFLLGALYAAAFVRQRNLFVPWLGHSLTDFALDANALFTT